MKHGDKVQRTVYLLEFDGECTSQEELLERVNKKIVEITTTVCPICLDRNCDDWECVEDYEMHATHSEEKIRWTERIIAAATSEREIEWLRLELSLEYHKRVVSKYEGMRVKAEELLKGDTI
jgi:urate oxidase